MIRLRTKLAGLFGAGLLAVALSAPAQNQPTGGPPRNLISNPSFENVVNRENPWDGTNRQGFLEMARGTLPVLTRAGTIGDTAMPVSVALGDLNGDMRLDLMVADVFGYMRVFFNSGTPQEPKFTKAELVPINISRPRDNDPQLNDTAPGVRHGSFFYRGPRVHLADVSRKGMLDIWLGNYIGEVFMLPNTGSAGIPEFRQPADLARVRVATSSDPTRRWGNVFAPALYDFDGDGRLDLLLGEGSYSANSIHLLLNRGRGSPPQFTEDDRHVLAFGMGREQLTPAVVDYNGNGRPDLLVADGSGKIGLYQSNSERWQPGDHLEFVSYLSVGGDAAKEMSFGGISTVAAGDLTGNGLFDLVVGKTNGRVAFVKNVGTRTEPKFEAPVEIKGEVSDGFLLPAGWEVTFGQNKGNFLGYATVVTNQDDPAAAPPDGDRALKFGYLPSPNKIIRGQFDWGRGAVRGAAARYTRDPFNVLSATNTFGLRQPGRRLEVGKTYTLSFRAKGTRVSNAEGFLEYTGHVQLGERKYKDVGRGGRVIVDRNRLYEEVRDPLPISVGNNWTTVTRDFRIGFDEKGLEKELTTVNATILIRFDLAPGSGEMYFDDFKLVEKR